MCLEEGKSGDVLWQEVLDRSTEYGAVSALILDLVRVQKNLDNLRVLGVSGDYAAVEEKLNALRSEFTRQFNTTASIESEMSSEDGIRRQ